MANDDFVETHAAGSVDFNAHAYALVEILHDAILEDAPLERLTLPQTMAPRFLSFSLIFLPLLLQLNEIATEKLVHLALTEEALRRAVLASLRSDENLVRYSVEQVAQLLLLESGHLGLQE